MIKNITQNELVLLAYNELPPDQHDEMMAQVKNDPSMHSKYLELKQQMDILDSVQYEPNPTSVQIVLEESCSSSSLEMI
jgi:hypothetical protein